MNIGDIFVSANRHLPDGEKAKSVSVYRLPYPDFNEVYVECESGKRFRALANNSLTVSDFVEVKFNVK